MSLQLIVSFLLLFCTGIPGCNQAPVLCRHRRYGKGSFKHRPGLLSVVQLRCTLSMLRYEISVSPASVPALKKHMDASPKSSIWLGFPFINHPFWGTPHLWKHPRLLRGAEASILCTVVLQVTSWRGSRFQFETVETQSLGVVQLSNSPHS